MKWSVVLFFALSVPVLAQQQQKCPPRETYKSLRFDEDWSALRDPGSNSGIAVNCDKFSPQRTHHGGLAAHHGGLAAQRAQI